MKIYFNTNVLSIVLHTFHMKLQNGLHKLQPYIDVLTQMGMWEAKMFVEYWQHKGITVYGPPTIALSNGEAPGRSG